MKLGLTCRSSFEVLAAMLAAAALPACAHAQDRQPAPAAPTDTDADTLKQSDEVIVTGVTAKTKKRDATFSINTLTQDDIKQLAPMSTADLLGNIPGFFAEGSTAGEASNNITVRGLPVAGGYRYAPQLNDGLPVYQEPDIPFMNNDVFIRTDLMTDRVEVVKGGPGGILYSNGLGATVNYVTRTGTQKFQGEYRVEAASYGFLRNDLYISGPVTKNVTFALGGFYRISKGIRDTGYIADRGGQIRGNLAFTSDDGSFKATIYAHFINDRTGFFHDLPIEVPGFSAPGTAADPIRISTSTVKPIGVDFFHGTLLSPYNRYIYQAGEYGTRTTDIGNGIHPKFSIFTGVVEKTLDSGWDFKFSARGMQGTADFNVIFTGNDAATVDKFLGERYTNDVLQTAFDAQWQQDFNGVSHRSNVLNQYFTPISDAVFDAKYRQPILQAGFSNFAQVRAQWGADVGKGVGVKGYYVDNGQPIASSEYLSYLIPWVVKTNAASYVQDLQAKKTFDFLGTHNLTLGGYHSFYSDNYNFQASLIIGTLNTPSRMVDVKVVDANGNPVGDPLSINGSWLPGFYGNTVDGKFDGMAAYIQDHWEAFNHRLKIDWGVRWETELAKLVFQNRTCCFSARTATNNSPALDQLQFPGTPQRLDDRYHALGWSVGANWSFSNSLAVYGLASRSFRLPSFSDAIGFAQSAPLTSAVERIQQYEGGVRFLKTEFDLSVALYYNKFQPRLQINNYQDITSPACGTNPTNVSTCPTVAEQYYYGIKNYGTEVEAAWRPAFVPGLELRANVVAQNPRVQGSSFHSVVAVFDTSNNVTGFKTIVISQDGRRPGRLAQYNVNFMPSFNMDNLTKIPVKLYAQMNYFSSRYSNSNDYNVTLYPAYYYINAGFFASLSKRLMLQFHVANLTNQFTFTEGDPLYYDLKAPDGQGNRGIARPTFGRNYRVFLNYKF